jgi:hypothetical protein
MFGSSDKLVDGYNGMISILFLKCFSFYAKSKGNHEKKLGDYDLLIFDEQKNTIFNIECKYISQSFAAKDLKNDLESLYGIKKGFEKSYIGHFLKRQNYLETNAEKICENTEVL